MAGALLEQAEDLLDRGIHPSKIADGYDYACQIACRRLDEVADKIEFTKDNMEPLMKIAMTSLGSKIVSKAPRHFAKIAIDAVLAVADIERRDVDFELIKVPLLLLFSFFSIFYFLSLSISFFFL